MSLIRTLLPTEKGIRLLGVTVSNFAAPQLLLISRYRFSSLHIYHRMRDSSAKGGEHDDRVPGLGITLLETWHVAVGWWLLAGETTARPYRSNLRGSRVMAG